MLRRLWLGPSRSNATSSEPGPGTCAVSATGLPAGAATAAQALQSGCPDLLLPFDVRAFAQGHGATNFMRALDAGPGQDYAIEYESGYEPWFISAR